MSEDTPAEEIRSRMMGDERALFDSLGVLVKFRPARFVMKSLGLDTDELDSLLAKTDDLTRTMAEAVRIFAERAWAPSGSIPADLYERACQLARAGDVDAAEKELVRGWNEESVLKYLPMKVRTMGSEDPELANFARQRSRLLQLAWEDHEAGRYHTLLLVVSQIDGICADATGGRQFFSLGKGQADVADDSTIAGMNEALPIVRKALSERFLETAVSGSANRHGAMHGRELSFDTRINSTKLWVLLAAVVEWARPLLDAEANRRKQERLEHWTGSDEVDDEGRRMDRRGFVATRRRLRDLALDQTAFFNKNDRFGNVAELSDVPYLSVGHDGLGTIELSDATDDEWWAWSRSEAGWVFAIGASEGEQSFWRYWDGPEPPTSPPSEWSTQETPNWSGDCA